MDEVAIKFEKIDLDGLKILFKPVSVIKGKLDKKENLFVTDYGLFCDPINTSDFDAIDYFGYCMTMDKLKELYNSENEEEILFKYFQECNRFFYIGYFDYEKEITNVVSLPFSQVVEQFIKIEEQEQNSDEVEISLDEETLRQLEKMEDISQIKDFINKILLSIDNIKQQDTPKEELHVEEENNKLGKTKEKKFNLIELRKELLQNIIGQDEAVRDITRALAINYTSSNPRNKSHILITGPSGTGKTEIINLIAKELDLPVFKADATAYTKSGYVGKDVQSMLAGLVEAANGDIEKAQKGILIIDEIDKKSSDSKDDVSGKSVLHSLLKIMDRDVMEVDMGMYETIMFDTSNITMVFMGSFDELYKEKQEKNKLDNKSMGFNRSHKKEEQKEQLRLTEDDLVKWLGPEFVGRLGLITSTNKLSIDDVVKILSDSKISQFRVVKEDFKDRGKKLLCTSGYLKEIAKQGTSEETGVRKLNKVVKENLKYLYEEVLKNDEEKTYILTMRTAKNGRIYKTKS